MTTDTGGAPQGRSRWMTAALVASLALNLVFIGGAARAIWHHKHDGGRRGDDAGLFGFVRNLPSERAALVRGDLELARQTVRPMRKAVRDAWYEANTVLTTEPFDKDKYKAAMDRLTEAEGRFKAAIAASLADTAAKLTPEERVKLQGWREKRRPHVFGRHGRHDGNGDGKGEGKGDDRD